MMILDRTQFFSDGEKYVSDYSYSILSDNTSQCNWHAKEIKGTHLGKTNKQKTTNF